MADAVAADAVAADAVVADAVAADAVAADAAVLAVAGDGDTENHPRAFLPAPACRPDSRRETRGLVGNAGTGVKARTGTPKLRGSNSYD